MSILDDNLFAEKRRRLQELQDELNKDKAEIQLILGEWLAKALADNNQEVLQEIFLSEYNNVKYLKAKSKRSLLANVADNLQKNIEKGLKVTQSSFEPPRAKAEVKTEPQEEATRQADLYGDPRTQADNELRF
ncbi:hypothetical protein [Psychrobacter ciconiae]|uniref:hypothetical protein n=1 Tax=Psychrobacter ciconiae TaxID=1553449 RepID=UPI001919E88E|nr:hypothetical protein [Psychrobacter ciconiae]